MNTPAKLTSDEREKAVRARAWLAALSVLSATAFFGLLSIFAWSLVAGRKLVGFVAAMLAAGPCLTVFYDCGSGPDVHHKLARTHGC